MSYDPPPSPPLPTFAIKDLCGPSNPPALISISKRRYDATLNSNPTAALLYLDDDDGELITVGSSLELSQRLEEPVPKYIRGLQDPVDGKLVHVFDINHSTASLFEWRDHEAYSSKHFNPLSPPFHSPQTKSPLLPKSLDPQVTYPSLPENYDATLSSKPHAQLHTQSQKSPGAFDLLDGIESHLSGLANILQVAATTLQRAADKTKETDTSMVEDILKGVKDILTEVGAFGLVASRNLDSNFGTAIGGKSASTAAEIPDESVPVKKDENVATQLTQETKAEHGIRSLPRDNLSSVPKIQASKSATVEDVPCEDLAPKVKFNLPERPARKELTQLDLNRLIPLHARSARSDQSSKLNLMEEPSTSKSQSPSFLDDSSEDADFTARYPPLSTVRRVRSTIERPSQWPIDRREKVKSLCKHYRGLARADGAMPAISPAGLAQHTSTDEPLVNGQNRSDDRTEDAEAVQKPLPGAWPDVKNDSAPALPTSTESSGDFFNRMVGRGRPARYRAFGLESGLHRANTTASSNPASRLNGPFDPGFPYEPSSNSSYRPNTFGPYRSYRRSASPTCWSKFPPPTRPRTDKQPSVNSDTNPAYSPSHSDKFSAPLEDASRSSIDDLFHRAIRHHRSVPQFHAPPSAPYQIMNPRVTAIDSWPPAQSATDFLTGPPMPTSMPMPPPMPFTTRPTFPIRSTPPNLWAPWQSSPPMPVQPPVDERINPPNINGFSSHNESDSPVSSQSTTNGDLEFLSNDPPFPSAQPQFPSSSPLYRYPTPPRPAPAFPSPIPPPPRPFMRLEPAKDKIHECVEQLKICGFGHDDENLKNRLHVYAVAADGDVIEAVEMIEQDRRMTAPGRFDGV